MDITHNITFGSNLSSGGFPPDRGNNYNTFVTFIILSFFSRSRAQFKPLHRFSRWMAQTTCFRPMKVLLGVMTMGNVIWGKHAPIMGSVKPKSRNIFIAIYPELLIVPTTRDLKTTKYTSWVICTLPQSKFNMADGRHLENWYFLIFPPRMVQFGWNLAGWYRITCRLCRVV